MFLIKKDFQIVSRLKYKLDCSALNEKVIQSK